MTDYYFIKGEIACCNCSARTAYDFEVKKFGHDGSCLFVKAPQYPPDGWSEHDERYYCNTIECTEALQEAQRRRW